MDIAEPIKSMTQLNIPLDDVTQVQILIPTKYNLVILNADIIGHDPTAMNQSRSKHINDITTNLCWLLDLWVSLKQFNDV